MSEDEKDTTKLETQVGTKDQTQDQTQEERKYAGKFSTIEQLEEGYKNSAKVYQENESLKNQLEEISKAPDEYIQPQGVQLGETDLNTVTNLAKNAGLTQKHFEKLALGWANRNQSKQQAFEQKIKEIGDETINVLKDYVSKNYPDKVADTVLKKLITDKEARQSALTHRTQTLNSAAPGFSKVNMGLSYTVTHEDVLKARSAAQSQPSNLKMRDRYIALTAEYVKQKDGT